MVDTIPARLHVLLARNSDMALIIRRGPSERVASIGWNRKTDEFTSGQWLKGRIYPFRSDISPDGKHWIYFAMGSYSNTWTAVAQTPYLKAIDFHTKGDAWNGGGLFISDKEYWLNDGGIPHKTERKGSLKITKNYPESSTYQGECFGVYYLRLIRDGWVADKDWVKLGKYDDIFYFTKPINSCWSLVKIFHANVNHPIGKGVYYEEHKLVNAKTGNEIACPDWEWAEVENNPFYTKQDYNYVFWAEKGKLMKGQVAPNNLGIAIELYDFNDMKYEEIVASY